MSTARQLALLCAFGGLGLCQAQVDPAAAQALGQRIEREVEAQRGAQFLQGCFDAGALTALTVRGLSPTTEQLATIQASVQASVPDLIAAVLGRKNSFHLVTFVGEGAPRLVFRRVEPEGFALSYVSLYVALRGGVIRRRVVGMKALTSAITIGTGGSAGSEGPIVQIAAAAGSTQR